MATHVGMDAELRAQFESNRAAIAAERDRLATLAERLRTAGAVVPAPRANRHHADDVVVEHVLRGCFHVARMVDRALEGDLLGWHEDPDHDAFVDAERTEHTLEHLQSATPVVHEWGEEELATVLADLQEGVELLAGLAAPDRQVLLFDVSAAGTVVEVFGDLTTAQHVAVVVPGMGTTVQRFESSVAARARRLHRAASGLVADGAVAVLAWLGYRAPGELALMDAAAERLANEGAQELADFVHGLARRDGVHQTVVAHSYGSVVAGLAAHHHGLPVQDLVVLGSPGMGVATARELRIEPDGRVWAVRARHDPITDVPVLQVGSVRLHGTSPYDPSFGSRVVAIDDEGHSSYLDGDAGVRVVARIVVGEEPTEARP